MRLPMLFAVSWWCSPFFRAPLPLRQLSLRGIRQLSGARPQQHVPSNLAMMARLERGDQNPPARKAVMTGQELELEVSRMSAGAGKGTGMGIAWYNRQIIFVDGAFPGSKVLAKVKKVKKDFAEARLVKVLTPSPDAVDPPCKYVVPGGGGCGGCKMQEISYSAQLAIKQEQVNKTMERVIAECGSGPETLQTIIPAQPDKTLRFRNRMDFSFKPRAASMGKGGLKNTGDKADRGAVAAGASDGASGAKFALGLHQSGAWKSVIDIEHCLLQSELADQVYHTARRWLLAAPLTAWDPEEMKGYLRELGIRSGGEVGTEREQIMVNVITSLDAPSELQPLADLLVATFGDRITSVINTVVPQKYSTPAPDNVQATHVLAGSGQMTARVRGLDFLVSPASFFQTNPTQTETLYKLVEDLCNANAESVIYDLYCGTGTIGLSIARNTQAKLVVGFEIVESAVLDARKNAEANNVTAAQFFCGDLSELLRTLDFRKEFGRPDVAIIDPPRPGMHPQCVKDVVRLWPKRIVYVSCNPSTQARDIAALHEQGGYRLLSLHPVDMFPHSPHVESVALLER